MNIFKNKKPTSDINSDTSGFYKFDGIMVHAPNFVINSEYELHRETKDGNSYPIDGWHWFNSQSYAKSFFGINT